MARFEKDYRVDLLVQGEWHTHEEVGGTRSHAITVGKSWHASLPEYAVRVMRGAEVLWQFPEPEPEAAS